MIGRFVVVFIFFNTPGRRAEGGQVQCQEKYWAEGGGRTADNEGQWRTADREKFLLRFSNAYIIIKVALSVEM